MLSRLSQRPALPEPTSPSSVESPALSTLWQYPIEALSQPLPLGYVAIEA